MGDTKIEWTEKTWNPIRSRRISDDSHGWYCEHVSEGCRNCYAEKMNHNTYFGNGLDYKPATLPEVELFLDEKILEQPLHWRNSQNVFPCSMTDLFGHWVPDGWVMRILNIMARTSHVYQILTKRPERMRSFFTRWADLSGEDFNPKLVRGPEETRKAHPSPRGQLFAAMLEAMGEPPAGCAYPTFDWLEGMIRWPRIFHNLWLGVSCEDQKTADERIPLLLQTPAAVRWISAEPLLKWIDVTEYLGWNKAYSTKLDWVVAGGESGPKSRPMHPYWIDSLRDQCLAAEIPFFFKQWGEWLPVEGIAPTELLKHDRRLIYAADDNMDECNVFRVGKKNAGRLLDGREWSEYPKARAVAA